MCGQTHPRQVSNVIEGRFVPGDELQHTCKDVRTLDITRSAPFPRASPAAPVCFQRYQPNQRHERLPSLLRQKHP